MCASTLCPFSSSTRNMALGSGSTTVPSTRIVSSLGLARTSTYFRSGARKRRAKSSRSRPTILYGPPARAQSDISSDGRFGRALPREGQHLRAVVGDCDGVLEVRRAPVVAGDDRPAVGQHLGGRAAGIDHGLDREDVAFLELHAPAGRPVVR